MNLAPVVLFTYNRLDHTKKTIEALQTNFLAKDTTLFIYSDGPKNADAVSKVEDIRKYIHDIDGFAAIEIIERDRNWGLADSIIDGVTTIVNKYGKIIVLEDDIVTSPYFLSFMNDALDMYKNDEQVMHISGYFYPVDSTGLPETFFYNQTSCWGWATWSRAWKHFNGDAKYLLQQIKTQKRIKQFNIDGNFRFSSTLRDNAKGKIKTWAIKWQASVFLQNGLCLHPRISLVDNIGNDGSGTNCNNNSTFNTSGHNNEIPLSKHNLVESIEARLLAGRFLSSLKIPITKKIFNRIINIIRV